MNAQFCRSISTARQLALLLISLAFIASTSHIGQAQPIDTSGRWKEFRIGLPVVLPPVGAVQDTFVRDWSVASEFFHTPAFGFGEWKKSASEVGFFRTTDSGNTWQRWGDRIPVPHVLWGAEGISESGMGTADSGHTWTPLMIDTMAIGRVFFDIRGSYRGSDTLLAQYDGGRLALSPNRGRTWIKLDTVVLAPIANPNQPGRVDTLRVLSRSLYFGDVPGLDSVDSWIARRSSVSYYDGVWLYIALMRIGRDGTRDWILWRICMHDGASAILPLPFSPFTDEATNLRFVSPRRGYVFSGQMLYRTLDSGKTWDTVSEPTGFDFSTMKVKFLSETYGIVAGGYSSDFGLTWKKWWKPLESAFFALDSLHLWGGSAKHYFRSTDAGRTWTERSGVTPSIALGSMQSTGNDIYLRIGDDVILSQDSGATWSFMERVPGLPRDIASLVLRFRQRSDLTIGVGAEPATFDGPGRWGVFTTADDGLSWQHVGYADTLPVATSSVLPAVPIGGSASFLYSGSRLLWRSTNGLSWQRQPDTAVITMARLGTGSVLLSIPTAISASTDDGLTWRKVLDLPVPFHEMTPIYSVDSLHLVGYCQEKMASPATYRAYRTTDGGRNWWWSPYSNGPSGSPLSLEVYFLSQGRSISYSIDSGKTFQKVFDVPSVFRRSGRIGNYVYFIRTDSMIIGRWEIGIRDTAASIVSSERRNGNATSPCGLALEAGAIRLAVPLPSGMMPESYAITGIRGDLLATGDISKAGVSSRDNVDIPLPDLGCGVYVVKIVGGGSVLSRRILILR